MTYLDDLTEVQSSNIAAIGERDGHLIVRFNNGVAYRYPERARTMDEMIAAESMGKFFHQNLAFAKCEKLCSKGCWSPVVDKCGLCQACLDKVNK